MDGYTCELDTIHEGAVAAVRAAMPEDDVLMDLAELFKLFGDGTRVKILCALEQSELCVCDIASLLDMTKSAISHQLALLRRARLVKCRREGKSVYYSLADAHVGTVFAQGLAHVRE